MKQQHITKTTSSQLEKLPSKKFLMSKELMIRVNKWKNFETYPHQHENIILHIKGYRIRENKYCHDFIQIKNFDAIAFDKRDYTPVIESIVWNYEWLPTKTLMI